MVLNSQAREQTQTFRPVLETLENRCCPSTIAVHGNVLLIQGNNQANVVTISDDGQGGISATLDGKTASGTGITNIVMILKNGDDSVTYAATGKLESSLHVVIQAGRGD